MSPLMRSQSRRAPAPGHALALTMLLAAAVPAFTATASPSVADYTLRKQVLAPGSESTGGPVRLAATLAEPGAGVASGGSFRLTGGFQTPRPATPGDALHANGFE